MALKLGDKIPNFSSIDTTGVLFDSSSIIGKKPTVIYFYPKDNTRVCTDPPSCSRRATAAA